MLVVRGGEAVGALVFLLRLGGLLVYLLGLLVPCRATAGLGVARLLPEGEEVAR
jgi:hypothetical protein